MTEIDQRNQIVGVQYNADTIINGVPFETWKSDLAEKQKRLEELLVSSTLSQKEKEDYQRRLAEVERQRLDEQGSYEAHIKELLDRISRLDKLAGQLPDKIIEEAKAAIANGENDLAEKLFTQVEEQADPHIAAAAEAAYQRGKLAEDAINYNEAFKHYHRATQLNPDETVYLNSAGLTSSTLGNFDKAIEYYEQALKIDLRAFGEDHPNVAIYRNNLGGAWVSLGQYEKTIEYLELALASDLKTYGEDHPSVARDRNNLGFA